jgi:tripartite-type tricarboxylate transporter receptor subunit TctC/ABC-type uncharacterized transport system substrate-binding protein
MKLPRRQFLHLAAGAAALPAVSRLAWGQAYPARPVRIIVGFAAGGGADIVARLIGRWLSDRLGQQFVVENRVGAGTNIATEVVARAAPDGCTLLLVNPANAINATLYDKLNFDFIRDVAPVGGIVRSPGVMVVNASFPAKTVPEFIAYAKANPGKINMASAGIGATSHLAGEMFKAMAGVDLVHVPYRGDAPAVADLLGDQVQVYFGGPGAIENARNGNLRALAVTTATRSQVLPEIPALTEFVPGYEASAWYGIGVPKNTPANIIDKRFGDGDLARGRALAAELVAMNPDVLLTDNTPLVQEFQRLTRTVPIVFAGIADPVASGIVKSLARPGDNATGFMNPEPAISERWLQLLKEIAPSLSRVLVLVQAGNVGNQARLRVIEAAAPAFGVQVSSAAIRSEADIENAIRADVGQLKTGLIVPPAPRNGLVRRAIFEQAARHRLPAIYPSRRDVADGGLMSYGSEPGPMWEQAATYVDRILRGEKPADLPVQAPSKIEFVINLNTAKTLGLTIPETLLATADEVIQ